MKSISSQAFTLVVMVHGYKKTKRTDGVYWIGLKIDITKIEEITAKYPMIDYKQLFGIYKQLHDEILLDKTQAVTVMTDNSILLEIIKNSKTSDKDKIFEIKKVCEKSVIRSSGYSGR